MPSSVHELIVELLRDGELVRVLLAVGGDSRGAAPGCRRNACHPQIRADVALLFGGEHRLAVVVEVQRSRDPQKQWAWPLYEAAARARHKCDACVLVFATDDLVAQRFRPSGIASGSSYAIGGSRP